MRSSFSGGFAGLKHSKPGFICEAPAATGVPIMLVLRFLGSLFLLGAVIALTADLSRPARPDIPRFASLQKHWADMAPQSLASAQKSVQTRTHAIVWDPVITSVLAVPAFATLGALALMLFYIGRPRRRVEIFVN